MSAPQSDSPPPAGRPRSSIAQSICAAALVLYAIYFDATTQLSEEPNEENQTEQPVPVEIRQPAWSSNLTLVSGTGTLLSFITIIFIVALLNFDATWYAFIVTLTFLALTTAEGQLITPTVLGRSMKMNPAVVFFTIIFWGWMWGLMGVLLSVPILIAIRMACEEAAPLVPIARMLGADAAEDDENAANDWGDDDRKKPPADRDAGLTIVMPGGD